MKQLLALALLLSFTSAWAQKSRIQFLADSLLVVIDQQPDDSNQCQRYCLLSNYYRQLNTDTAIVYARKAIAISSNLHYNNGLKCGYNNLGIALYTNSNYGGAIEAFEQYKQVCIRMRDSVNIAWAYNNIGNVYIDLARYSTTLLYYDSALQVRILLNDSASIAQSYTNFGYIHKEQGSYTEALVNLYNAVRILEPMNDENSLMYCYDFLGSVYALRKKYAYSNSFYDKALTLYRKLHNRSGEAIALHAIGSNYYAQGQYQTGKRFLQQAYSIYNELNDTRQLAILSSTLSDIYVTENKPDSALILAEQSIAYHLQIKNERQLGAAYLKLAKAQITLKQNARAILTALKAVELLKQTHERNSYKAAMLILSELYSQQKQYNLAYQYQQQYIALNDSMVSESSEKAIADMQTKYETAQKDLEIGKQAMEIKRKQTQLLFSALMIITILVVSVLVYYSYRLKQKQELAFIKLSEQQTRNKAIIEAEEKERIRIARELHDGIGQQLSAAKMNLSAFENKIQPHDKPGYELLLQLVDDAVKEVRSVSHNMMPNALIRSGLVSAVRDFVHKLSSSDAIKVDLQIVGLNSRLEETTETVLYRVLQECVSNIIKHAQASHISIQLIKHDSHLNMMIEDNGKGFDTNLVQSAEGIGLKNMLSRIAYLNGIIDFDSSPGNGTIVNIDIPL